MKKMNMERKRCNELFYTKPMRKPSTRITFVEERSLNETIKSVAGCARNQGTGNSRHLETEVSLKNQTDKWGPVRLVLVQSIIS